MEGGHKGNNVKVEMRCREFSDIGRDVVAIISAMKMCDITRQFSDRKIVHVFIKSGMGCNLDLCGFNVVPENVLCCMWKAAKKDPFPRIWAEFGGAMSRRADPDTTSEGLDVQGVFLFVSCKRKWQSQLRWFWQFVGHAKCMTECTRPEFNIQIGAKEEHLHSVHKCAMSAFDRSILARVV